MSSIPRWLRDFPFYHIPSQFLLLVRHRIMQRMCPDISPKPIQAHFTRRCPRSGNLKHPARHPQCRIRSHHLYTRHPFGYFSPLGGSNVPLFGTVFIDGGDLKAGDIGERFGRAKVCEEGAIALEDVRFFGAVGDRVRGVGPGAGAFGGVVRGEVERAQGNADVEVGEHQLNANGERLSCCPLGMRGECGGPTLEEAASPKGLLKYSGSGL